MRCLHLHWILTWNLVTVVSSFSSSPDISITSDVLESRGPHETVSAIMVLSSSQINVTCGPEEPVDAYESHESNPSVLHDLKLEVTSTDEGPALKVSWAVIVDASTSSLSGLWLEVKQRDALWCQYSPPFNSVSIMDVDVLWFSYIVQVEPESYYHIVAHNLPEPPFGSKIKIRKSKDIFTPACDDAIMKSHPKCVNREPTRQFEPTEKTASSTQSDNHSRSSLIVSVSMLVTLLVFATGFSLYTGHRWALRSPSKTTYECAPVSVLIVYPAMDGVFQQAVVALADFLQSSGTCKVAIDVWQRESLAELGPLRWLHTLAETSNRVLVLLPGRAKDCDESVRRLLAPSQMGHTVPASAYELYPLALKIPGKSKLRVVHLGKATAKSSMPVELRGCRSFALLKDLQKLLHDLCPERKAARGPWLKCWVGGGRQNSDKALGKLNEMVQQLERYGVIEQSNMV